MKKYFLPALAILVIGVFVMNSVFAPRMGGSPYVSQENAIEDLSGWKEDALDRTWTYVSANAAGNTFVVSATGDLTDIFRVSLRFRAKQGGGYEHFIIHYVEYVALDGITKLTIFGGASGDLINAAITDVAFSAERFPAGFPVGEDEWAVEYSDAITRDQASPAQHDWYNINSALIVLPAPGVWNCEYDVSLYFSSASNDATVYSTLSTTSSTESNDRWTRGFRVGLASGTILGFVSVHAEGEIAVESETTIYLNTQTGSTSVSSISNAGGIHPTIIRAVSGYY